MAETSKRRSDRISLTLPLSISGRDAAGNPFSEDANTVTVSLHGAAIALKTELTPGQDIIICRLRTPCSPPGRMPRAGANREATGFAHFQRGIPGISSGFLGCLLSAVTL